MAKKYNNQVFLFLIAPKFKKCIFPVVTVALLLVVTVFVVVNFQSWYNEYASSIFANSETKNNIGLVDVNDLIGDSLYVKYTGNEDMAIKKIKIGDNECNLTNIANLTAGVNEINISDCLSGLSSKNQNIVIVTDKKISEKNVYLDDLSVSTSSEEDMSLSLSCTTDTDEDGYFSYTCAVYPMAETSYEGILDPDDTYDSTGVDFYCYLKDNKSSCEDNFIVDGCGTGTVLDAGTGLCWQRDMSTAGQKTWENAKNYCDSLELGDHTDWYLPSRQELSSLRDLSRWNPAIVGGNNNKFQNIESVAYWTVSTFITSGSAWNINQLNGEIDYSNKVFLAYVTCVRKN